MRTFLIPAAAAFIALSAPLAYAAETSGIVEFYDMGHNTLEMKGGEVFQLPKSFNEPGLQGGDRVHVTYQMKDGKRVASSVVVEEGHRDHD